MKTKLKTITSAIIIAVASLFTLAPVYADEDICSSNAPDKMKEAAGCFNDGNISNVVTNIINAIIGVIGIVAVIFIIMGGVQYMTASGDASKAKKAKDTILYACIGLAVCALAFAIANFAIDAVNNSH